MQALRETRESFDVIFNDIDKEGYPAALPVIHAKLRPGGVFIADNLLWHGQVLDPSDATPDTVAIRELTPLVTTSAEWTSMVVPIRDGLLVARRNG